MKNMYCFGFSKKRELFCFWRVLKSLEKDAVTGLVPDLGEFFKDSFRGLGVLPEQNWSLDETELISLHYENRALLPDNDAKDIKKKSSLVLPDNHRSCGPFALKDPELTIIPDSCIYQVPLAALADGGDRFVSETFRIRIVPSLMTLRLIQDSPL